MRQEIINIYKFSELSEKAQRRAWDQSPDETYLYDDEFSATLAAFEKIFDIDVYRYNVDPFWNPSWSYVKAGKADDCPDGDPLRVARFMWNNYARFISKGKYYSTPGRWINGKYTYKFRHSRTTFEMDNCPLTGVCWDLDILQPIIDCLHYKRFFNSIDDLYNECLHSFFHSWQAQKDYLQSFDYFADTCDANDYEFLETGEMWK